MRKKLKSNLGETLVETLTAIIICVLSVGVLTTGIILASRINASSEKADAAYDEALKSAEGMEEAAGEVTITFDFTGSSDTTGQAALYGRADGDFAAYRKEAGG